MRRLAGHDAVGRSMLWPGATYRPRAFIVGLVLLLDHAAAARAFEIAFRARPRAASRPRGKRTHSKRGMKILAAMRARPAPNDGACPAARAPDRAFDVLGRRDVPEQQAAVLILHDLDHPAPAGRRDHADEIGIGVAAPFDRARADRLGLSCCASISSYSSTSASAAGSDFSAADDPACAKRNGTPAITLRVFVMRLPRATLIGERRRFIEQRHDARLELLGQELLVRADVQDRRRASGRAADRRCPASLRSCRTARRSP